MKEGLPIYHMASGSVQNCSCEALGTILNLTSLSDADLLSVSAALTITNTAAIKDVVMEERCVGILMAEELRTLVSQQSATTLKPIAKLSRIYSTRLMYREADLLRYLNRSEDKLNAFN